MIYYNIKYALFYNYRVLFDQLTHPSEILKCQKGTYRSRNIGVRSVEIKSQQRLLKI